MKNNFYVCKEDDFYEFMMSENSKHKNLPKVYMAGYTRFCSWVYEDYSPDGDYFNERFYVLDYSSDGEDAVWDKFFDFKAVEAFNEMNYEKITVDKEEYNIDICFNEFEYCSLSAFWHSAQMSEEEIEWLKGKGG